MTILLSTVSSQLEANGYTVNERNTDITMFSMGVKS